MIAAIVPRAKWIVVACACVAALPLFAQTDSVTVEKLRLVANLVLKQTSFVMVDEKDGHEFTSADRAPSNAILRLKSPYNDWRYWNGVLNIAMIRVSGVLHAGEFAAFSTRNVAFSFDNYRYFEKRYNGEGKWNYPFGQRFIMEELDDCGAMGASVIEVSRGAVQDRYEAYIDQAAEHMRTKQARLEDGTFVRAFPHTWTLWADDLYMSLVFLSRLGERSHDPGVFDDAAKQVIGFHKHLFDTNAGLMHHCWYSDLNAAGVAFWGRANGWALLAQVDLLDRLPGNHPQRDTLLALLRRHILGIARYQGNEGLWHQLLDKADSYVETSCSAMFTYAVARAVCKGYLEPRYASIADRGWEGVSSRIRPDGQVEGVSAGTGVSNDLVYYYLRPTPLNDPHGIGAVLLAGSEVLQLHKKGK